MKPFQEILIQAGYPAATLVLDFESFFAVGYRMGKFKDSISLIEYVCDDRFEFTGMGDAFISDTGTVGPTNFFKPDELQRYFDAARIAYGLEFEKVTLAGQNLKFDCLILQKRFGIVPKYTVDLLDLGNMHDPKAPHSLDKMGNEWGAPVSKGDTNQFKGVHAKDIDYKKMSEYCGGDIDITKFLIQVMLPAIMARPEIEIPLATHTLHMFLNESFEIDIPRAGIVQQRMLLELAAAITRAGKVVGEDFGHDDISKPTIFVPMFKAILEKHGEKLPMKKNDKNKLIPALAKTDQAMEELLHNPIEEIRVLAEAKVAVGGWPGHIKKVKNTVLQAKARGGMMSGQLGYCRGKTWRWGGVGGINQHNMGGRGRAGRGTHPLISEVRQIYKAPIGCILGIPDFAAIEARNLAWQAGQDDLTAMFATGADIYSAFATELFKAHVRKPRDTDPKPLRDLYQLRRGFGKDAILGCGYGMGSLKFYANCYINPSLRPFFDSGKYNWEFIDKLIKLYRTKYSKIPEFWRDVEKAWRFVTKFKSEERIVNDNLRFYHKDHATFIELPSGRYIRYPGAKVTGKGDLSYKYAKGIWGGYLVENIIQSESRDILAESILRLDQAGFWVALHVHDENVLVLPKETAEEDLAEAIKIMEIIPDWASGLPITVEGQLSERYCK
jgi:DNA polymerase